MEEEQYLRKLVKRYIDRTATDTELEIFIQLFNDGKLDAYVKEAFEQDAGIQEIDKENFPVIIKRRIWARVVAAASIVLMFSVAGYFLLTRTKVVQQTAENAKDILPGSNGAILTLSNGKRIVLEQRKVGAIAAGVKKSNDSLLTYTGQQQPGINSLETPKGRQYTVVLPDGSKVWLNAESKLTYPTDFVNERLVELKGEAYFQVVHNVKMPFRVKSRKQITEDLGTSFNINTYDDENVAVTTLIEGVIAVNRQLLKPGQASFVNLKGNMELRGVNPLNAIAWKNGLFSYRKARVDEVMRQFARWYDVEVAYESGVPEGSITGSTYRNVNLLKALEILKYLNIHYEIEGKKILIKQ